MIASLDMPSNMPAGKVQLADSLNMSGTPVREALKGLSAEGRIGLRAKAETMVTPILPEAVRIARFARETEEPGILQMAAKSSSNQVLFSMGQATEEQELAVAQSDVDHFHRADDKMHRALCRHARATPSGSRCRMPGRTWTGCTERDCRMQICPTCWRITAGSPLRPSSAMSLRRAIS